MIGFTSASRVGDRDLNVCVKGMTGGKGMEVRGDVMVLKEVGRGAGVYGDVSVFDLAVLKKGLAEVGKHLELLAISFVSLLVLCKTVSVNVSYGKQTITDWRVWQAPSNVRVLMQRVKRAPICYKSVPDICWSDPTLRI